MAATDWTNEFTERLRSQFPDSGLEYKAYLGQNFITGPAAMVLPLLQYLRDAERFDMLVDLTAVDYPKDEKRFEVIYELYSFDRNERLRVKCRVGVSDTMASIVAVYRGADWLEREAYDMFGIAFQGHPGLKRILMPEEWTGFPLRKDYSIIEMDQEWVQAHLGIESGQ